MPREKTRPPYEKRPVQTPDGPFDGLRAAADHYKISKQAISSKCRRQVDGGKWRFLDVSTPDSDWLIWNVEEIAQ